MVDIHFLCFGNITFGFIVIPHSVIAQCHHIFAVNQVLAIQTVIPNQQVGQGHGEIIHAHMVVKMVLTVVYQFVESAVRLIHASQLEQRHACIEYLVGLGIIVVHGGGRLSGSLRGFFPTGSRLLLLVFSLISTAHEIIEVILLCIKELALTKVMGIDEALAQQLDGILVTLFSDGYLCQLHTSILILRRHFAFAALPGMENVAVKEFFGFRIAFRLVQKSNLLQQQGIALGCQGRVLPKKFKALLLTLLQSLVELVQFHQDAGIGGVQGEGALHARQSFVLIILLVHIDERQIAPDRGEVAIERRRLYPILLGQVILTFVVIEQSQQIRSQCIVGGGFYGRLEGKNGFKAVGEAIIR